MLLNLSNHPSDRWPENQRLAATTQYQEITDLPFPQIPPELTSHELEILVDKFEKEIKILNPSAVHIMGEMTFTFQLVTRLKASEIPCIASTTLRITHEENNIKTSLFEFIQFREY